MQEIVPGGQVGWLLDIVPVSSQGSGKCEGSVVDDLAHECDDGDLFGSDVDDGGDVLVGVFFGDGDDLAEEIDVAVGAHVADDFDAAFGGQGGWRFVSG